jgi:hypothetical protein
MRGMISWGDVPTWVAAVGTVGTLTSALWQIGSERRRRLASEEQLRADRHVEQARLIAAYLGDEFDGSQSQAGGSDQGQTEVFLVNNSPEPVYALAVGIVFVQGAAPHSLEDMLKLNRDQFQGRRGPVTTVSILPGGLYRVWISGTGWGRIIPGRIGVGLAFSDAAGAHWIRRATGHLSELAEPPLEYLKQFDFHGPHDFQTPERVSGT